MTRLPFEPVPSPPARRPAPRSGSPDADRPLTVTQAATLVKQALVEHLPSRIRIVGEISNFSDRAHWFFSMKDDGACIRCVCFASAVKRVGFAVRDGMQVVAIGRIDYYESQGQLQLYVDRIEPVGQGALELRFRALCEELRKLGYFDEARRKALPRMAQCIAVITSRSAAALQDVIDTAGRRWPGCRLLLVDVRVQGERAAPEIAQAIRRLSDQGPALGVDAILLTRGGGSIEDLWAFNEREVADAIFECRLPLVAAIGHETDTTIAELVADARCATPTQAAMTLVPDRQALEHQVRQLRQRMHLLVARHVQHCGHRLASVVRHPVFRRPQRLLDPVCQRLQLLGARLKSALPHRLESGERRLESLARHPLFRRPQRLVEPAAQQVERDTQRLRQAMVMHLQARRERLESLARELQAVAPQSVLQRGYSYTLDAAGRVIRDAGAVRPGDRITTVLADGRIASTVDGQSSRPVGPPAEPVIRRPRRMRSGSDGPTLFEDA